MPVYNFKCSKCEVIFEIFQSMTERDESPPTHCPECDPEVVGEATLSQIILPGNLPRFRITGEGAYHPNKLQ
tara:strand:- start:58 stop:273 length:216 start_codon:yes stop_codon:yes gene_type:complete